MECFNIRHPAERVTLSEAILRGLGKDEGLFMPSTLPQIPRDLLSTFPERTFPEIATTLGTLWLEGTISTENVAAMVTSAYDFPVPLTPLTDDRVVLELCHGPTLAFKDFGARFMARVMQSLLHNEERELLVLAATSGDTGAAVAHAYHNLPNVRVAILYPKGKVSPLQERTLTSLGGNVSAFAIEGSFDDCQHLVKKAMSTPALQDRFVLATGNSINLARLIPQTFYHAWLWAQLAEVKQPLVVSVPSGNMGNVTAGLLAKRMGIPIDHFVIATNSNDAVPNMLASGIYEPQPTVHTISNAMDIGAPNNVPRLLALYDDDVSALRRDVTGIAVSEEETEQTMRAVYDEHRYMLDPHGAVGMRALARYAREHPVGTGVVLETAHPAKFQDTVERVLGVECPVPAGLEELLQAPMQYETVPAAPEQLLEHLLHH